MVRQGCLSPATELLEFFEEIEQDFLEKKSQKLEFGQTITNDFVSNTIR